MTLGCIRHIGGDPGFIYNNYNDNNYHDDDNDNDNNNIYIYIYIYKLILNISLMDFALPSPMIRPLLEGHCGILGVDFKFQG